MSSRARSLLAVIVTLCITAAIVRATPTVGQIFSILSTGNVNDEIMVRSRVPLPSTEEVRSASDDDKDEWVAKFSANGPTTFQVLDVTLLPNGHTGWHHHPAILLSSMISGSIEWYDVQCNKHVYNAGDSFTENTAIHDVRNVGAANAHFMITYIIAKGQPRRIDEPAPACAAALGLD
jgi:quercetin dioxygenase-like cupin family protein